MQRNSAKITVDGRAMCWLGANFWSRTGGPLMWRSFDPAVVRDELAMLRRHGLGMTRSFFYWPDFMPEPDRIDEAMAARFASFLDLHTDAGMTTVPTFIVGHMSGENWDPPWREGRDLYSDVWLVARQAWFAGEMVRRFTRHPAVSGWLVSNEMPIYGRPDPPREAVSAWAQIMRDAVRAAGGHQPFSLGDGAWGTRGAGHENGFWLEDAAVLCDFVGPHVYPVGTDEIRQHYAAAWECELAGTYGRPVVLEEFGISSDHASALHAARYYRQVLNNCLLAGATGWIAWCNTDFELSGQDPYRHHAFELHFGLTDSRGAPKLQLAETATFAGLLDAVDIARCERAPVDTALVLPGYLDTKYPFTPPELAGYLHETLRQCYVSARLADLPVALTRESSGIATGARLYLVPSVPRLLGPTWLELLKLAHGGATVYLSYSAGPVSDHRGPSHDGLGPAFGVEHQLRAGLADRIEDDSVTLQFRQEFGPLAAGSALCFAAAGNEHSRAYLPVQPTDAQVIAVDARGRPALLARQVGSGSMVLCTYPIEHMAAVTPDVNPDATVSLYRALAEHAGVTSVVTVDDPRVAADVMVRSDGARFAWLVSQAADQLTVRPRLADGLALMPLTGGARQDAVMLDPFGVSVLRLDDAAG